MLGEDGVESLQPWDNCCRMHTRSIRNPIERAKATSRLFTAKHLGGGPRKVPKRKQTKEEYAESVVA